MQTFFAFDHDWNWMKDDFIGFLIEIDCTKASFPKCINIPRTQSIELKKRTSPGSYKG